MATKTQVAGHSVLSSGLPSCPQLDVDFGALLALWCGLSANLHPLIHFLAYADPPQALTGRFGGCLVKSSIVLQHQQILGHDISLL